jgi:tetratricopeptide (TPR) repeat protein
LLEFTVPENFIEFLAHEHDRLTDGAAAPPTPCPDENLWALLADNALSPSQRSSLIEHVSDCVPCRRLASEIIAEWDVAATSHTGAETFVPGRKRGIARFRRMIPYAAAASIVLAVGLYFLFSGPRGTEASLLAQASQQIAAGQYDVAVSQLAAAMERGHKSAAVKRLRGQALLGSTLALAQPGQSRVTSLGIADILHRRTKDLPVIPVPAVRLDQALGFLRDAADSEPATADGWRQLGAALLVAHEYKQAAEAFSHWTRLQPDSAEAQNAYGLALYGGEDYSPAAAAFAQAAALAPQVAAYQLNTAMAYDEAEEPQKAATCLNRFLELEPAGPQADQARQWLDALQSGVP